MGKLIKIGETFESNTEYYADKKRYDVYLSDAVIQESKVYTACRDSGCAEGEYDNKLKIAFFLKDKENIVLDFRGATLYLHGLMQPFLLDNCKNVTIKNCIIEYDRSFVSEAEVIESTKSYLKVKMFNQFPYRIDGGNLILISETWENDSLDKSPKFFQFFNKETRKGAGLRLAIIGKNPHLDENWPWANATLKLWAEEDGEYIIFHGNDLPNIECGLILAIAHSNRQYSGIMIVSCENIYLQDIRLLNGPGMGLLPMHTKNLYIDGFKLCYDERSPGIIANEADGIHAVACSGDFILKNSIIEGIIDDALNIHSNFYQVTSSEGDTIKAFPAGAVSAEYKIFDKGDTIAIYKGATLEKNAEYIIKDLRCLEDKIVEIKVDRPLLKHEKGDVIENLSAQAKVNISNCRFGKANTHLRFQTRGGVLIENCETDLPFWLTGDMSYWFESSPVDNIVIRNTKFATPDAVISSIPEFMPTEKEPYYHGNLVVEDCEFMAGTPVYANYTKSIRFIRNQSSIGVEMTLDLTNCGDCEADGCKVLRKIAKKDMLSVN